MGHAADRERIGWFGRRQHELELTWESAWKSLDRALGWKSTCQTLMSRVDEIVKGIDELPRDEFRRVAAWICKRENENWDAQMDRDAASGRLDFLLEEAEAETKAGLVRDWPPSE